jgi:hypothetical protein
MGNSLTPYPLPLAPYPLPLTVVNQVSYLATAREDVS